MKQSVSDLFAMDEFADSETQAPKAYEMVPNDHFRETDDDKRAYVRYLRILPLLTTLLQRRIAATLILDRESATYVKYRLVGSGLDRKTFIQAKRAVQAALRSVNRQLLHEEVL